MSANLCVCCGEKIPEGKMTCYKCEVMSKEKSPKKMTNYERIKSMAVETTIENLSERLSELREKHWDEYCRIVQYDDELKQAKEYIKFLMDCTNNPCSDCKYYEGSYNCLEKIKEINAFLKGEKKDNEGDSIQRTES